MCCLQEAGEGVHPADASDENEGANECNEREGDALLLAEPAPRYRRDIRRRRGMCGGAESDGHTCDGRGAAGCGQSGGGGAPDSGSVHRVEEEKRDADDGSDDDWLVSNRVEAGEDLHVGWAGEGDRG